MSLIHELRDRLGFMKDNLTILTIRQMVGVFFRRMVLSYASLFIIAVGGDSSQIGIIGFAGGLGGGRLRGGGYMGGPAWQALIADLVPSHDRGKVMGLMALLLVYWAYPGHILEAICMRETPINCF
ncbi:hypothetical protein MUP51_01825 [Candidatus Bathyarchaeota archaeon]|nr:hypothetical protein [Candidatus Bathyarchaeota archaeon]